MYTYMYIYKYIYINPYKHVSMLIELVCVCARVCVCVCLYGVGCAWVLVRQRALNKRGKYTQRVIKILKNAHKRSQQHRSI